MRGKEDLFHLVKAMSKSEKRYFTIDAQKSGRKGSKYLELFQAISSMDEYDEAKLKKKFPKNLPSDKAYLYEAILRSMRDYRSAKSKSAQIKEMILDSKYLYEMGLYLQSQERLQGAKELAKELDDRLAMLEINREERILAWNVNKTQYKEVIESLVQEKEKSINALGEEFRFSDISYQLFNEVNQKFDIRDEKAKERIRTSYSEKLIEEPIFPYAKHRYYQSKGIYYQLLGDLEKVYEYFTKVVEWWDNNPEYKEEEFHRYIVDFSNLLHAYAVNKEYQRFPSLFKKLDEEQPKNLHDQRLLFQKASIYKLMYYINFGLEDANIDSVVANIDEGLDKYNIRGSSRVVIIFNVSFLYFILGKYQKCIEWTQKITKETRVNSRKDIQLGAHLLKLIAILDVGDVDLIDKSIRSTMRYLNKAANLSSESFEYKFINYIKKLAYASFGELNDLYDDFKRYLKEILSNPKERNSLGLDELTIYWINSKKTKNTIAHLIKLKKAN